MLNVTFNKGDKITLNGKEYILTILEDKPVLPQFHLQEISKEDVQIFLQTATNKLLNTTISQAANTSKKKAHELLDYAKKQIKVPNVLAVSSKTLEIINITNELTNLLIQEGLSKKEIKDRLVTIWYKDAIKNVKSFKQMQKQRINNYIDYTLTEYNSKVNEDKQINKVLVY